MPKVSEITKMREELSQMRELLDSTLRTSRRELLQAAAQADHNKEHPDPTPVEIPVGVEAPPTLHELVQTQVAQAMDRYAIQEDMGTFEEEDDFEPVDEELLPMSGYEIHEYEMDEEIVPEAPQEAQDPTSASNEANAASDTVEAVQARVAPLPSPETEAPTGQPNPQ